MVFTCIECEEQLPVNKFSDIGERTCDSCMDSSYERSSIRIICDLCDLEMPQSKKDNGIWVCPKCDKKYPDVI
tara:strand:+ start:422 stop:640 length:219 start_codon:yes stop_codon:yes gene_type:complete